MKGRIYTLNDLRGRNAPLADSLQSAYDLSVMASDSLRGDQKADRAHKQAIDYYMVGVYDADQTLNFARGLM